MNRPYLNMKRPAQQPETHYLNTPTIYKYPFQYRLARVRIMDLNLNNE